MNNMRNLIIGALALILLFGCIGQSAPTQKAELGGKLNQTVRIPAASLISVGGEENLSVVTIRTANSTFPMQGYPDEFIDAGLYSDSFIELNSTYMKWLGPNESIWITPMIRDGKGVLFNAIYSNEISCNDSVVKILGKDYPISSLENGSSFGNDDKWKVVIEENGCLER